MTQRSDQETGRPRGSVHDALAPFFLDARADVRTPEIVERRYLACPALVVQAQGGICQPHKLKVQIQNVRG